MGQTSTRRARVFVAWLLATLLFSQQIQLTSAAPRPTPTTPTPTRLAGQDRPGPAAGGSISGRVLLDEDLSGGPSPGDRPVIGLAVSLSGNVRQGSQTGPSGTFTFTGLPAGTYTVVLALPGGVAALNGPARTVTLDGQVAVRVDFILVRADRVVINTPTPRPTATPQPTSTPTPQPPATPPAAESGAPTAPTVAHVARMGNFGAPLPSSRPFVGSTQGLRSALGLAAPTAARAVRTERLLWLGVPFITQLDGTPYSAVNCGPASTAMVLAAFGIHLAPAHIRDYVNYLSGVYSLDQGTSLRDLSRVVREAGLEVSHLEDERGGYVRWTTELLREVITSGRPVITLVRYRALPGHSGSLADTDHYIVIAGLAGQDFVYNDAAFSGDRGYGLLISPGDLERAWAYSSIPRHGMAVGLPRGREETAAAPTGDGLEIGDTLPADLASGDEGPLLEGDARALRFDRIMVDGNGTSEARAESDASFELGGFVDTETSRVSRALGATALAPRPSSPPPSVPWIDAAPPLPLIALAVGGLVVLGLVALVFRRAA